MARSLFDDGVGPLELVQARALLSAAGLALIPAAWKRPSKGAAGTAIALGISIALVNAVYYIAIERLAVAVALVLQYTGPALLVGWVAFTTKKAPSRDIVLALAAAFVGVVLVSEVFSEDLGDLDGIGMACGVAAALFFATYTLLSERAGAAYGVIGALFRGFLAASVMWIVFQIPRGWPSELTTPEHLPSVLFIGLGGTLAPFLLYLWGVRRVNPQRAIIAATLEPPVAAVIAWVWLDQILSPLQIVGGVLTLAAVALLQVRRADPAPPPLPD
jgi:drug/metabolite transporter (DMT)-like permease